MKTKTIVTVCLLTLLAVASAYGAPLTTVNIPFQFSAGGNVLAAGQYNFSPDPKNSQIILVVGPKGTSALVPVVTRLAAGIHTTPQDSHIVFDKVGETYTLSELWYRGIDGFVLNTTTGPHEHRIVDIPNPK